MRRILLPVFLLATMAASASELTWTTLPNVPMDNTTSALVAQKNTIWALAASLVGNTSSGYWDGTPAAPGAGLWTHCGSSDSSTDVATVDGTCSHSANDRWAATGSGPFAVGKIVNADEASNHSWYVLRSPSGFGGQGAGTYFYLTVNVVSNAAAPQLWLSSAAPTGNSGGTRTGRPTAAATETQLNTVGLEGTWASPSQYRAHLSIATTGDFWFFTSRDTTGNFYQVIGVTPLKDAKSGDIFPVVGASSSNKWTIYDAPGLTGYAAVIFKGRSAANAAADGALFTTTEEASEADGEVDVPVTAELAGIAGNTAAGVGMTL